MKVEKRDKDTLIPIIEKYVEKGSTIITDYKCLGKLGYQHKTVNHSENFVDPTSGTCTNLIENRWWCIKRQLPTTHTRSKTFDKHLMEYMWRTLYTDKSSLFDSFIQDMYKISSYTGLTISVIVAVCFGFEFKCPESSQWKFRKQICSTPDKYSCLYDIEKRIYTESCTENRDFVKAGKRYVRRGGIDSGDCIGSRYQPRKFWSNVNSVCEMVKNTCFEAGQVTVSDGSTVEDRACRCDFQKGFVFVAKQTDICSCIPSKEDCSCYSTTCHESEILTEDFYCENIKNMYKEAGKCLSIGESEIKLPKSTSLAGKSRKVYALDNNEHHRKEIHRYSHIVGKYLILCIGSFVMIFACAANIWIQATWHKVNVFQTVNLTPTSLLH